MKNSRVKIAVVGAGVMGLCAAHILNKTHHVDIIDNDYLTPSNASSLAGGMLCPYAEIDHLPQEFIQAGFEGIKFWKNVKGEIGFKQNGSLIIAHPEDEHMLARFAQKLPMRPLTDVSELEPSLKKFKNGLYLKEEAHLSPLRAMFILSSDLNHLVKNFDIEKDKKDYNWIIDCRGYAATQDDANLRGVKGEILLVRNSEFSLSRPVRLMHPRYSLYIIPRSHHEFSIGATLIESADTDVTLKSAMELLSAAYSLHPSFAEARIIELKAGIRPAYPDNLPRIKAEGNVIRCNGLFRHGYLLAPVMAGCVADFVAGKKNQFSSLFMRNHDHDQRNEEKNRRRA